MRITRYRENKMDACAAFWWNLYEDMPYVHRPDGGQTVNTPPIGPEYFIKHLGYGLENLDPSHPNWPGLLSEDDILLAEDNGKICGILVSSQDQEKSTGYILSAYVERTIHGREMANGLVDEALHHFSELGFHRAVAAPRLATMEVESPIHLSLLDADFAFNRIYSNECYGVFLGGSLEGFQLQPEITAKIDQLEKEGITFERILRKDSPDLRRLDTGDEIDPFDEDAECTFVACHRGFVVGSAHGVWIFEDEGRTLCMVSPFVIPSYRHRGIGKVLQHLGMEEAVRRGAWGGWVATGLDNPARFIYRSVGYRYWYTCSSDMSKQIR
ncbi:GNAT family N-acetyltransferase [Candidatus Bathyarchaeota archaeon]|jgi:GNAT superfamily N-acetyltransferase|nr:GNAT family N-acetyltransferase [Candidatus Bathyarchaeota archaeon]